MYRLKMSQSITLEIRGVGAPKTRRGINCKFAKAKGLVGCLSLVAAEQSGQ